MTTLAEPEWDQATRDLTLARDAVAMCQVCGGPAYLCQDAERQDDWKAEPPVRCHRTTAARAHQGKFSEKTNPHLDALVWPVTLRRRD